MVHEAMLLDYSGPALALAGTVRPDQTSFLALPAGRRDRPASLLPYGFALLGLIILIALIEVGNSQVPAVKSPRPAHFQR